ncbi:site-specific recombinase, phage integrase family [Pseudoalteromonas luteoviolacea B = ATCC 29581]|nr:site-specific recombinase, phage integrase family [Pseudoalteromonas luteoviolacea B = ATCC 29581]
MSVKTITQKRLSEFLGSAGERDKLSWEGIQGFYFIKLKSGGAWRLRYTDLTGKRRDATIGDHNLPPAKAQEIVLEWRAKLNQGVDPLGHKQQLAEQKRQAVQEAQAKRHIQTGVFFKDIYSPYKIKNYRRGNETLSGIARNFEHLFSRDMDKIAPADILAWYNKRRAKGIMRSSLVRDYGAFKAMLNYATRSDSVNIKPVLDSNPLKNYNLPQLTIEERDALEEHREALNAKRDIFSQQDKDGIAKGLYEYAEQLREQRRSSRIHGKAHLADLDKVTYPHWFIPFCHIARLTGMRPADIYALKWENLHYNELAKKTTLVFIPSKTKKAENSKKVKFPITGELKAIFELWAEQNGKPINGLIFKSERTGRTIERKAHLTHWKHVKRLGGVSADLEFYSFRHNFISSLVVRGVPVLTIAGLVGHADGSMIAENYLRHDESNTAHIIEALSESWEIETERRNQIIIDA